MFIYDVYSAKINKNTTNTNSNENRLILQSSNSMQDTLVMLIIKIITKYNKYIGLLKRLMLISTSQLVQDTIDKVVELNKRKNNAVVNGILYSNSNSNSNTSSSMSSASNDIQQSLGR